VASVQRRSLTPFYMIIVINACRQTHVPVSFIVWCIIIFCLHNFNTSAFFVDTTYFFLRRMYGYTEIMYKSDKLGAILTVQ
jgi:hypothetical protein